VCRARLQPGGGADREGRSWACEAGHSFDVSREGYVNLLAAGQRRSRQPGDSDEMVDARRRFLASGAYDPLTRALGRHAADAATRSGPAPLILDIGCGEGHHTRGVAGAVAAGGTAPPVVAGIDVSKRAISLAARNHREGWYAVASAGDLPVPPSTVDVALDVFGPVVAAELARVVRTDGTVIAVHPGPRHLASLRALVYADPHPHEVKPPLRGEPDWFETTGWEAVTFPVVVSDASVLADLFAMTPYRWHAPPDIGARLAAAAADGFATDADVIVTTYRRTGRP
jgi:23S rRNA (guanine745-N1)-methyltransferase